MFSAVENSVMSYSGETIMHVCTGDARCHLVPWNGAFTDASQDIIYIHKEIYKPLNEFCEQAFKNGFNLSVCSGYRSFQRQANIWNDKLSGKKPVLDAFGSPIKIENLTEWERVEAVLRWSALPGASRHHWGTDIDVYDSASMPDGYTLQLLHEETVGDGLFASMHQWLDHQIDPQYGFYRPYETDNGGVLPERWHLSYAPMSRFYAEAMDLSLLERRLLNSDICLLDTVLKNLEQIYERFICVGSTIRT
ncbi:MAG: D-alanyl-D-alanine carboxypeptidase family protein [Cellvibrionales bacterium TMED148]|nr:MAG: D-alanyl-D-alanine carboxypeptidase family protein [Cellvibrionales bacterium TMED148]